ncbi:hypothetical protein H0H81_005483 [Sphagnurus paluster]|uniref:DUF6532 domain-containing protein n=1 Tax=Sphagnurus paluster TaxID=117069 RepID=A0A9P7GLL5_9AGAR|nr:hypothetical protein H0H81_005483 [Sphagnurus paluster]
MTPHSSESSPTPVPIKRVGRVPPPPSAVAEISLQRLEDSGEESLQETDYGDHQHPPRQTPPRRTHNLPGANKDLNTDSDSSPVPSRSPSPEPGAKRPRAYNSDDEEPILVLVQAQKITEHAGRPKASDYEEVAKEVILAAGNIYRCLISTIDGFPDSGTEIEFIRTAWGRANKDAGVPPMALTPSIAKIIKQRGSQLRGEAKTKLAPLVETMYGFGSGHRRVTIAVNRALAEDLKSQKTYVYKTFVDDICQGIYQHPAIQKGVNKLWFSNTRDEGVAYTDMFNPLPIPAIALILTTIECCIDEWLTGTKCDVTYWADDYRDVYQKHIKSLQSFGEETRKYELLERLQKRLHNHGRLHAGAGPVALNDIPAIPTSAFQAALKEYEEDPDTDEDGEMEL